MSILPARSTPAAEQDAMTADWALFSKVPGCKMDYEILASTMDGGVAERCVRSVLTGHPDSEGTGRPDELPWYSITWQLGDRPAFAVMQLAWSEERDGTGQPITPARLVVTDWTGAARRDLTFSRMAEMFFGLRWTDLQFGPPGAGTNPILLPVPPSDLRAIAQDIDRFGAEFVAGIAALLLDGRHVVLTAGGAYPTVPERIRLIDAVLALLPYTYRRHLSASTWASYRIRHRARLTFAERSAQGQAEVSLDRRAVPAPQGGDGGSYLRVLARLRARGHTTEQVVRHLARQSDVDCRNALDAVDLLRMMDLKEAVQERIRAGRGDVAEVHTILAQYHWTGLDSDEMRHDYRAFLLDRAFAGQADATATWRTLDAFWNDDVLNGLARRAYDLLTRRDFKALSRLVALLNSRPRAVQHLVRLLTDEVTGDPRPDHVAAHRELLSTMPGDVVADPAIHQMFLGRPRAGAELISQLARDRQNGDSVAAVVRIWQPLITDEARWVRPMVAAVTGEMGYAQTRDFAALDEVRPDGVLAVLGLAARSGHLLRLVRDHWDELARFGSRLLLDDGDQGRAAFRSHLGAAQGNRWTDHPQWTGWKFRDAARIDLLCLLAHAPPAALDESGEQIGDTYLRELAQGWAAPVLRHVRGQLRDRLQGALEERAAGRRGLTGINDLIRIVDRVEPGLRPWAAPHVGAYVHAHIDKRASVRWTGEWLALVDPVFRRLGHFAKLCDQDTPAWTIVDALTPLLQLSDEALLYDVRRWLRPGRETRVLEAIAYLRDMGGRHRSFGQALQRTACDPMACPDFAPTFVDTVTWFGPIAAYIAGEINRDGGRPQSPNLLRRMWDKFPKRGPGGESQPTPARRDGTVERNQEQQ